MANQFNDELKRRLDAFIEGLDAETPAEREAAQADLSRFLEQLWSSDDPAYGRAIEYLKTKLKGGRPEVAARIRVTIAEDLLDIKLVKKEWIGTRKLGRWWYKYTIQIPKECDGLVCDIEVYIGTAEENKHAKEALIRAENDPKNRWAEGWEGDGTVDPEGRLRIFGQPLPEGAFQFKIATGPMSKAPDDATGPAPAEQDVDMVPSDKHQAPILKGKKKVKAPYEAP
jgi:hypothetical protein